MHTRHHQLLSEYSCFTMSTQSATSGDYAIHEAAQNDKPLTVQGLLSENPKLAISKDQDSRTPLHCACSLNNEKIIDIILPYVNVDIDDLVDDAGWTPLHIVSAIGNRSVLKKLMAKDPRPDINLPTGTGVTPLHLAVSKNHYDYVKDLLDDYRCSVSVKDNKGQTALHRAAAIGSQPIIRLLAAAKANVNAKDRDGWTPLHHALAEGHADAGALLVLLGADPLIESNAGERPAAVAVNEQVRKYFEKAI